MGAYPQGNNKERKLWLALRGLVSCAFCRYHRRENAPYKQYRTDKYKSKYRLQRKFKYKTMEEELEYQKYLNEVVDDG